ncbi:MAG: acetylglutamate kinase [Candidatus Omnitrophica bacterium]|jgi:acetylglutamate kinase|nr:acetylglutamate kinase [Candidatus Omnitrophota bacterium]MDD3274204.1 acetylglutamate kinase [Candidatus Omnitrophota bacterium]MDD5078009.1 acetylglutamate kinase [Candidatus Omnitrophota bacterium]MDD5725623.1 acetylglutamate kinase [Candidatus Omnitrophota bacterium]
MEEAIRKADVLIEALPYIKRFHKKVIVIKYGGSILGEEKIRKGILEDIVFLSFMGLRPVLVHGGGPNISERMRALGKKTEFVEGMRVTDEETLRLVEEELLVLNGLIVKELNELGAKAVGLNGKDNDLIQVEKKKVNGGKIDIGLVGQITGINTHFLSEELKKDRVAVVLPMGRGKDKKDYNVNADEAASSVASNMQAEKLVLLTNVKGIMRDPEDTRSFISTLTVDEVSGLIENKVIQQGMIPKVMACVEAINGGVKKTHIIDARTPHGLLLEIFTDQGVGSEIIK